MLLTQTVEYALRAMAVLASLETGEGIRAADLSQRTGVPVHYLSKIMRRLVLGRLVLSRKGHGGGFTLARPARQVRFAEILAAGDFVPEVNRCAFGWGSCDAKKPCPLHPAYSQLNESFQRWAQKTTLADMGTMTHLPGIDGLKAPKKKAAKKKAAKKKSSAARKR